MEYSHSLIAQQKFAALLTGMYPPTAASYNEGVVSDN